MKNLFVVTLFLSIALCACGSGTDHSNHGANETKNSTPSISAEVKTDTIHAHVFSCPMHPEVTGKEGDKCPKCGMALEHKK